MKINIYKQDIPTEYRQYVDSPDEAPDEVQVYDGDRENTYYYDTRNTTEDPFEAEGLEQLYEDMEADNVQAAVTETLNNNIEPEVTIQHLGDNDCFDVGRHLLWASDAGFIDYADKIKTLSEEEANEEFHNDSTVARISKKVREGVTTMQLSPDVLDKQDISQQHAIGHLSTDTETHYLAHEVGHLAHDKKLEKVDYDDVEYNQTWKDVLDGEYLDGIYTMEELIKDNVGNYAAASPNDFVVETWVGLIHGNQYNDTILQLYDDLNGPGVPQW